MTIALASIGLVSVGTVMASLARTQSAAGVLSLCYMLFGGVIFYLATKFSAFASLKDAAFESHSLPLLFLSLKQNVPLEKAPGLTKLAGLGGQVITAPGNKASGRFDPNPVVWSNIDPAQYDSGTLSVLPLQSA